MLLDAPRSLASEAAERDLGEAPAHRDTFPRVRLPSVVVRSLPSPSTTSLDCQLRIPATSVSLLPYPYQPITVSALRVSKVLLFTSSMNGY